jgi:hypothetical protein
VVDDGSDEQIQRQQLIDEQILFDEIEEAISSLAEKGLIVDSGRRRYSQRTGRYEIVWVAAEITRKLQ